MILAATVAPVLGLELAPSPGLATIPYGMQFLGLFLGALLFARLMNRYGRFRVFLLGGACLLSAGTLGYIAIEKSSLWVFSFAELLIGFFVSTGNCYRFAATDGLPDALVTRSGTFVIAGGVIASAIAPLFAKGLKEVQGFATFSAIYVLFTLLALALFIILNLWHRQFTKHHFTTHKTVVAPEANTAPMTSEIKTLVALGMTAGAMSYFIKTLMLIAAIMYLKLHYDYQYLPYTVPAHMMAMFLPAFILSYIISKVGKTAVTIQGFLILAVACMLPLIFSGTMVINVSLVLFGFGWNFAFTSATSIIGSIQGAARLKLQGYNEAVVALMGMVGAFLPGAALSALGWEPLNMVTLSLTLCLVVVLILLARRARMLCVNGAATQAA